LGNNAFSGCYNDAVVHNTTCRSKLLDVVKYLLVETTFPSKLLDVVKYLLVELTN
jgi:hypothetical protein